MRENFRENLQIIEIPDRCVCKNEPNSFTASWDCRSNSLLSLDGGFKRDCIKHVGDKSGCEGQKNLLGGKFCSWVKGKTIRKLDPTRKPISFAEGVKCSASNCKDGVCEDDFCVYTYPPTKGKGGKKSDCTGLIDPKKCPKLGKCPFDSWMHIFKSMDGIGKPQDLVKQIIGVMMKTDGSIIKRYMNKYDTLDWQNTNGNMYSEKNYNKPLFTLSIVNKKLGKALPAGLYLRTINNLTKFKKYDIKIFKDNIGWAETLGNIFTIPIKVSLEWTEENPIKVWVSFGSLRDTGASLKVSLVMKVIITIRANVVIGKPDLNQKDYLKGRDILPSINLPVMFGVDNFNIAIQYAKLLPTQTKCVNLGGSDLKKKCDKYSTRENPWGEKGNNKGIIGTGHPWGFGGSTEFKNMCDVPNKFKWPNKYWKKIKFNLCPANSRKDPTTWNCLTCPPGHKWWTGYSKNQKKGACYKCPASHPYKVALTKPNSSWACSKGFFYTDKVPAESVKDGRLTIPNQQVDEQIQKEACEKEAQNLQQPKDWMWVGRKKPKGEYKYKCNQQAESGKARWWVPDCPPGYKKLSSGIYKNNMCEWDMNYCPKGYVKDEIQSRRCRDNRSAKQWGVDALIWGLVGQVTVDVALLILCGNKSMEGCLVDKFLSGNTLLTIINTLKEKIYNSIPTGRKKLFKMGNFQLSINLMVGDQYVPRYIAPVAGKGQCVCMSNKQNTTKNIKGEVVPYMCINSPSGPDGGVNDCTKHGSVKGCKNQKNWLGKKFCKWVGPDPKKV